MNLKDKNTTELIKVILALKNESEVRKFLRDLMTESEIIEFSKRWQAVQMLDKNISYSKIVKETGLSSTTIARISKWLKNGTGGYRLMLNRLHHHNPTTLTKKGL